MSEAPVSHARSDTHAAVRNLAKLGGSLGTTLLIGFVIRPVLRRMMGPDAFGPLDAADGFVYTWFIVLGLGVDAYIRKEIPTRPRHANDFFGSLMVLRIIMLVPIFLLMQVVMEVTGRSLEFEELVWLLAATQFFMAVNATFAALLQSNTTVTGLSVVNVVSKIVWGGGAVVGVMAGFGVMGIAFAMLVGEAVKAVVSWWLCRRHMNLKISNWGLGPTKVIVLASLPYYLNSIFHTVYNKIDVFILNVVGQEHLGKTAGDQETAWYGAAAMLGGLSMLVTPLLLGVLMPLLARAKEKDGAEFDRLVKRSVELTLVMAIPLSLALGMGAETWLELMFGKDYVPATMSLRLLSPIYLFIYVSIVSAMVLQIENRAWQLTLISLVGLVVNLAANLLLVGPTLDHYGPASGAAACAAVQILTEGGVAITMMVMMGRRGFDRRSLLMIFKTAVVCAIVLGVDQMLRDQHVEAGKGFLRLVIDGVVYVVLVVVTKAVDPREILGFVREAFRRKREPQVA